MRVQLAIAAQILRARPREVFLTAAVTFVAMPVAVAVLEIGSAVAKWIAQ